MKKFILAVVVVLIFGYTLMIVAESGHKKTTIKTQEFSKPEINKVVNQEAKKEKEGFAFIKHYTDSIGLVVKEVLADAEKVDYKASKTIGRYFKNRYYVSIFTPMGSMGSTYSLVDTTSTKLENFPDKEIVINLPSNFGHPMFNKMAYYYPNWRSVMVAGIRSTKTYSKAVIFHELVHYYYADLRNNSVDLFPSEAYVREELLAHDLESRILDRESKGKYLELVKSFIEKYDFTIENNKLQFDEIDVAAFKSGLDQIFGAALSEEEGSFRNYQFINDLVREALISMKFDSAYIETQRIYTYIDIYNKLNDNS